MAKDQSLGRSIGLACFKLKLHPFQGKGFGVALLQDAVIRTAQAGDILGIRGLLVHALSIEAKAFYEHHGFVASPTQPMTLILSLKMA